MQRNAAIHNVLTGCRFTVGKDFGSALSVDFQSRNGSLPLQGAHWDGPESRAAVPNMRETALNQVPPDTQAPPQAQCARGARRATHTHKHTITHSTRAPHVNAQHHTSPVARHPATRTMHWDSLADAVCGGDPPPPGDVSGPTAVRPATQRTALRHACRGSHATAKGHHTCCTNHRGAITLSRGTVVVHATYSRPRMPTPTAPPRLSSPCWGVPSHSPRRAVGYAAGGGPFRERVHCLRLCCPCEGCLRLCCLCGGCLRLCCTCGGCLRLCCTCGGCLRLCCTCGGSLLVHRLWVHRPKGSCSLWGHWLLRCPRSGCCGLGGEQPTMIGQSAAIGDIRLLGRHTACQRNWGVSAAWCSARWNMRRPLRQHPQPQPFVAAFNSEHARPKSEVDSPRARVDIQISNEKTRKSWMGAAIHV